jgi:SAM-dependent methyltransferase
MFDWTSLGPDPTDPKAMGAVQDYLSSISHVIERPWGCEHASFTQFCDHWLFKQFNPSGPLLDIGFADHTCHPTDPGWRHGRLRKMINNCCGLDLNSERVAEIQEITKLDRLLAGDLTDKPNLPFDKFSGIFAGDVIEHMSNPGALLDFIQVNLSSDGIAIITTPNCYGRNARCTQKSGGVIDNLEHIAWFSPFQMNELCRRHHLNLKAVMYFREGRKRQLIQALIPALKTRQHRMRDNWCDSYSYILSQGAAK